MGTAVAEAAAQASAEVVWCTTWLDEPDRLDTFSEYLGMYPTILQVPDHIPVAMELPQWRVPNQNKLRVATFASQQFTDGSVWLDDDDWKSVLPGNIRLVRTEPKTGLRPNDLDRVKKAFNQMSNTTTVAPG